MTSDDSSEPSRASASPAQRVALRRGERSYEMFELRSLTGEGALLACRLMLELGETLELELRFDDGPPLQLSAQVSRLRHELPGVEVTFVAVDAAARARIENRAATAAST